MTDFTDDSNSSVSFTDDSKGSVSFTDDAGGTTSFTDDTNTIRYLNELLIEDGTQLLMETGETLLIEDSETSGFTFADDLESTTTFTDDTG